MSIPVAGSNDRWSKASSVQDLQSHCGRFLGEGTLVAVDVDGTLIDAKDPILRTENAHLCKRVIDHIGLRPSPYLAAPYECLDPDSPRWVQEIQQLNTHVIAFTAAAGRFPRESEKDVVPNWRAKQLSSFEFKFSDQREIVWAEKDPLPGRADVPILKHGILFSAGRSKGEVFEDYIKSLDRKFSRVIFVDDQEAYLMEMEETVTRLGMEYLGIWYHKKPEQYSVLTEHLDMKVGAQQLVLFQKTGQWPSEESVRVRLQPNSDKPPC